MFEILPVPPTRYHEWQSICTVLLSLFCILASYASVASLVTSIETAPASMIGWMSCIT